MHVVGEVGEGNLGFGALDADGADEQAHLILLPGEDMLDAGADFRFGGVRLCYAFGYGLAARLLAVNAVTRLCRLSHASLAWLR